MDDYKMPSVEVGDSIMFARDPQASDGWTFGIVEMVGENNIGVWVPRCPDNWFRENVRHRSDPIWKNEHKRQIMLEDNDSGVWVQRTKDREFAQMKEDVAKLRAIIEQLGGDFANAPIPEPKKNKGGRPKGKTSKKRTGSPDPDYLKPANYDEVPEGVEVLPEVEEDEDLDPSLYAEEVQG